VLNLLDRTVPVGDSTSLSSTPRKPLIQTRRVEQRGDLSVEISYESDIANLLDTGTDPHPIVARFGSALVFVWPAGPRELAVNPGTSLFAFKSVMHPGSHKHDGWWSNIVNAEVWERLLNTHARSIPL
jgi:hypothetical protein